MQESIESLARKASQMGSLRLVQFLQNIRWINVMFNLNTTGPHETGECGINVVAKRSGSSTRIVLAQRRSKLVGPFVDALIGVLSLDPSSGVSRFAVVDNEPAHQRM